MPDATDRVLWGATTPGYLAEQLPNITGVANSLPSSWSGTSYGTNGAITITNIGGLAYAGHSNGTNIKLEINASDSSSVYTDDGIVRPAALGVIICIKY